MLAASDGRCWHLIWNGSCLLTIILGSHWSHIRRLWPLIGQGLPTHEGGETVTLTVARISRVMRNTVRAPHLLRHLSQLQHNNTNKSLQCYRKIILKKPQEQQVCLFQIKKHLTFWLEDQATLSVFIANQCMIGGHFC